jgi:hypothetical protein
MTTFEDDDDLDEFEDDVVDEDAGEEELGSTLPTDVGYDDPFDPNNQAGDLIGGLPTSPDVDDDDAGVDEEDDDDDDADA